MKGRKYLDMGLIVKSKEDANASDRIFEQIVEEFGSYEESSGMGFFNGPEPIVADSQQQVPRHRYDKAIKRLHELAKEAGLVVDYPPL